MEMVLGLDVTICRNVRSIPLHLCKLLYKRLAMKIHSSIGSGPSGLLHFGTKTKNEQSHKKFKSYLLSGSNSVSKKRDFVESLCSLIVAMSSFYKFHLHLVFRKGLAEKSILYFFRILRNKPTIIATVVSLVEHDTILYETHYYYS